MKLFVEHIVRNIADALLYKGIFIDGQTVQRNRAEIRPVDAGDVADGGGFACAIGTEESEYGPARYADAYVVERKVVGVLLVDVLDFEYVHLIVAYGLLYGIFILYLLYIYGIFIVCCS